MNSLDVFETAQREDENQDVEDLQHKDPGLRERKRQRLSDESNIREGEANVKVVAVDDGLDDESNAGREDKVQIIDLSSPVSSSPKSPPGEEILEKNTEEQRVFATFVKPLSNLPAAGRTNRIDLKLDGGLVPSLIVVDLDHTLWPATLLANKFPPFESTGIVAGACRCKDAAGNSDELRLYSDVVKLLSELQSHGIRLAIASSSPSAKVAQIALRALGVLSMFKLDSICVFAGNKEPHLRKIMEMNRGVNPQNILFFDDLKPNIRTAERLGIYAHQVDRANGFCISAWHTALRNWRSTRATANSFRLFFSKPASSM
mmetsp:Transcript_16347/g.31752  ORF Transcript_16347/g.31752 Transcript_16347/m.31752 type:complete len:317 (-) Transcript_16347:916-1866(-)